MKHRPKPKLVVAPPSLAEPTALEKRVGLSGSPISADVLDVSPDDAAKWLERNHPSNRSISWGAVESFANDMRAGAWRLTHQAVCFDADGYLIDGQHRLHAVKQAGVTVKLLVIRNQEGSFHDPIDRGRPRSVATIMGVAHREVSALNVLRMCEAGYPIHSPMTLHEAELVAVRHQEHIQELSKVPLRAKLPGSVVAACIWAYPVSPERTAEFAHKTASGEMIGRGDPCFAFRSWRERNKRAGTWEVALAAFNCLRHFLTDVSLSSVYTGEIGYRAVCAQRRKLRVSHTPTTDVVPGVSWMPDGRRRPTEEEG
jgi:hypothetical protein